MTHTGLSTKDGIVDNRISAERCKNVAALIFEVLRIVPPARQRAISDRFNPSIAHFHALTTFCAELPTLKAANIKDEQFAPRDRAAL